MQTFQLECRSPEFFGAVAPNRLDCHAMPRAEIARPVAIASLALSVAWGSASAAPQSAPELGTLMKEIGQRVAGYYRRAQHLICIEQSTVQPVASNWSPEGLSRTVESELRVEFEAADGDSLPDAKVIRDVRRINGRLPRERDKKDRSGCTDPNPLSPEPLSFLLPAHREEYQFTSVRDASEKNRPVLVIEFTTIDRKSRPELIEEGVHDACFDWRGPVATRGRLWVDRDTYEVLRLDRGLHGPVDVRVPWSLQRRYDFGSWVVLERDDLSLRYKAVAFNDPDEVMMLPASIDSMTVLRSALQSIRRTETFSDYRRFLTSGRIVK